MTDAPRRQTLRAATQPSELVTMVGLAALSRSRPASAATTASRPGPGGNSRQPRLSRSTAPKTRRHQTNRTIAAERRTQRRTPGPGTGQVPGRRLARPRPCARSCRCWCLRNFWPCSACGCRAADDKARLAPGTQRQVDPSSCADPAAGDRRQATRQRPPSFGQRVLRSFPERTAVSPVSAAVPEPVPRAVAGALAPSPSCTGTSWTSPDLLAVRPAPARAPGQQGRRTRVTAIHSCPPISQSREIEEIRI